MPGATPEQIDQSEAFYLSREAYRPFDLTRDGQIRLGCIEPRDQIGKTLRTVMQSPGAAHGEGVDRAVSEIVVGGRNTDLLDAITADSKSRPDIKLCGHRDCAAIHNHIPILREMEQPSERTVDLTERWIGVYQLGDVVTRRVLDKVKAAAGTLADSTKNLSEAVVLDHVDGLYGGVNVAVMKGENTAGFYIVNHHSHLGLDRHGKHRNGPLACPPAMAYHDSLGANLAHLEGLGSGMPHDQVAARLGSRLLRAAATNTAINAMPRQAPLRQVEVSLTRSGLLVPRIIS